MKEASLDVTFFDHDWLMNHKSWFDAEDLSPRAEQNRFVATPDKKIVKYYKNGPDNRLPQYRPSFLNNVMVKL